MNVIFSRTGQAIDNMFVCFQDSKIKQRLEERIIRKKQQETENLFKQEYYKEMKSNDYETGFMKEFEFMRDQERYRQDQTGGASEDIYGKRPVVQQRKKAVRQAAMTNDRLPPKLKQ